MLNRRNFVTNIFLISAAIGLSGCSGGSEAEPAPAGPQTLQFQQKLDSSTKEATPDFEAEDGSLITLPPNDGGASSPNGDYWKVTQNAVELTLHGSSSCPPQIAKVTQDESKVEVHLKEAKSEMACTLDLRAHTYELLSPLSGSVQEVELISDNGAVTVLKRQAMQ